MDISPEGRFKRPEGAVQATGGSGLFWCCGAHMAYTIVCCVFIGFVPYSSIKICIFVLSERLANLTTTRPE